MQSASKEEADKEEDGDGESGMMLGNLGEACQYLKAVKGLIYINPSMIHALKFTESIDKLFLSCKTITDKDMRKKKQLPISMFFSQNKQATHATTPPFPPSETVPLTDDSSNLHSSVVETVPSYSDDIDSDDPKPCQ